MSHTFSTQGFVLQRRDYTETAHMYTLYTYDYGKIQAVCRGSKKIQSKLAPYLENHDALKFFLVQGRRRITIIGIDYVTRFPNLFQDYQKLVYASYCLELVERLMKNNDRDVEVYELLQKALALLEQQSSGYDLIIHGFTLKLMVLLGLTPQLYMCLKCSEDLAPEGNVFSVGEGGVVCQRCMFNHGVGGIDILDNTIKVLRLMSSHDLDAILVVGMTHDVRTQIALIISRYFKYHIDRNIKSLQLLIT